MHIYTKEVIEEYAPSYLGKFIISDVRNGDATSHTDTINSWLYSI